jgi:hypothetical protein
VFIHQINEHEFFRHWVADSTFEEYTQRMLCDGEWGDHVELTAMSEMYERPIEIYAYKREPYKVAPVQMGNRLLFSPLYLSRRFHSSFMFEIIN